MLNTIVPDVLRNGKFSVLVKLTTKPLESSNKQSNSAGESGHARSRKPGFTLQRRARKRECALEKSTANSQPSIIQSRRHARSVASMSSFAQACSKRKLRLDSEGVVCRSHCPSD